MQETRETPQRSIPTGMAIETAPIRAIALWGVAFTGWANPNGLKNKPSSESE